MNNELEAMKFLAWLLQDLDPTIAAPSGESSPDVGLAALGDSDLHVDPLDTSKTGDPVQGHRPEGSGVFSFEQTQPFEPGDRPAVQDRFQTLLKRRLRTEIERRPPLFPWESDLQDYEAEELAVPRFVSPAFWTAQAAQLNLPVPMPQAVLEQLLTRCQALLQTAGQEGKRLVQAVESFFPGQTSALNDLAGMVLAAPARSGTATQAPAASLPGFPSHYDAANPAQQMALSLIAARELFNLLTLAIAPHQSTAERQWQTPAGVLNLRVNAADPDCLRVEADLPCAGKVQLGTDHNSTQAQRGDAGTVTLMLAEPDWQQSQPLQVSLAIANHPALVFVIQKTEA